MDAENARGRDELTLSSPLPAVDVIVVGCSAGGVSALKTLVDRASED
jgi:chemotaxis response regulator CheB